MTLNKKAKIILALGAMVLGSQAQATSLEQQRSTFREAYAKARGGDTRVLAQYQATLKDYPLWPDLVSASYLGRLSKVSDADVMAHLERYPNTSLNTTLRYRHTTSLAKRGQWRAYLTHYEHFRNDGDTTLDCYARQADLTLGDSRAHRNAALDLWMVGKSQPDACDALFRMLSSRDELTPRRHAQRLHLALANGQIKLARFLVKQAPQAESQWLARWERMRADPAAELEKIGRIRRSAMRTELYQYGLKRLGRRDPVRAWRVLGATAADAELTQEQTDALARVVALSAARDGESEAAGWIARLPAPGARLEAWRVRAALSASDWQGVADAVDAMADGRGDDATWRYWRARADEALGRGDSARALYEVLASERSYYGFLAADRLGRGYAFSHESIASDETVMRSLQSDPAIVRARELFYAGLYGPARSEWDRVTQAYDVATRRQAALLADSWGWHSSSIKTLARSAGGNDLIRSFPTPYKQHFDETTAKADIARTWAYGITRSESLFMSDVKSSAGAIGLMQLIPRTGREVARRAKLPYRGTSTLLDPHANIRLGVHYLGQMYSRFDDNQVLATAAYNAGPTRVKSWLPRDADRPADIWVETIPFDETRKYVKRVLYADTVFHWRLTGVERRLAALMPPIDANRPGPIARK